MKRACHCEASVGRRSNLGRRIVERDCFAEPVLGLAEGKTRGLAMTPMIRRCRTMGVN